MSKGTPPRSVRVADDIWKPAEKRAKSEGTTIGHEIREFLAAYGNNTNQKDQNK